ncbi:MarR family transcriptional regulator [Phenylobacterium deserti]|uniref:MarR family transcriptional regulator n=1 Tax=Phenylobacterium deserti TaxID=1914756 RepID=A0A328ATE7_9CAUL|nr:MarR family transcriptional regulator [Phenylobacterium deserti]RAK56774.1 MarR family transcriptional regulator [Phenylobacterium deserti]
MDDPTSAKALLADAPLFDRAQIELELAREVVLVGRRWRARLDERLSKIGQTNARWATLYWIATAESALNQREVAERVGIETPTLVRILDQLEAQGLVVRTPDPDDRRAKIITATPAAEAALAEGDQIAAELRVQLMAQFELEALNTSLHVLKQLRAGLEKV